MIGQEPQLRAAWFMNVWQLAIMFCLEGWSVQLPVDHAVVVGVARHSLSNLLGVHLVADRYNLLFPRGLECVLVRQLRHPLAVRLVRAVCLPAVYHVEGSERGRGLRIPVIRIGPQAENADRVAAGSIGK